MDRRAQGISLNVIVIAAIALLILVILSALVLNSGSGVNRGVNACESLGTPGVHYTCADADIGCGQGWIPNPSRRCVDAEEGFPETCCIPLE